MSGMAHCCCPGTLLNNENLRLWAEIVFELKKKIRVHQLCSFKLMSHNKPWLKQVRLWTQPWQPIDFCKYYNREIKMGMHEVQKFCTRVAGHFVASTQSTRRWSIQSRCFGINPETWSPTSNLHSSSNIEKITQIWQSCWPNLCLAAFTWWHWLLLRRQTTNWSPAQPHIQADSAALSRKVFLHEARFQDSLQWYDSGGCLCLLARVG